MKKYITLIFIILLISSVCGFGQGLVRFEIRTMKKENNTIFYDYDVKIGAKAIASSQALRLSPRFEFGDQFHCLPSVTVLGGNKSEVIRRWKQNHNIKEDSIFTLINQKKDTIFNFRGNIPYENWMENGEFVFSHEIMGYRGESTVTTIALKVAIERDSAELYNSLPDKTLATPMTSKESFQSESKHLVSHINYPNGSVMIVIDYMNNADQKRKLDDFIKLFDEKQGVIVDKISIKSYASPEGRFLLNEKLANKRTEELVRYMMDKTHLQPELFECESIAEDWEGLENIIRTTDMPGKAKVLEIIHSTGVFEGRELKLMKLDRGIPYKYMQKNIFPKLRRTICKITYSTKK